MPSLLDILGYAGNFLDLPGSSVRDMLSGNNPFDQWATPFSSDNRASGRDVLRPFLGENEETGMSGWVTNPMEGVKDIAGFGLEMVADPLNFVSLSPLWRALKGRKAVKGANAAQELANRGRYGYVNAKLLADDMLGVADETDDVLDEVVNPMAEQADPKLLGYTPAPENPMFPGREVVHHGGYDWSASATTEHPYGMFDLGMLKAGEGNNVYGPGAYFADVPETSAGYREIAQRKMNESATKNPMYQLRNVIDDYTDNMNEPLDVDQLRDFFRAEADNPIMAKAGELFDVIDRNDYFGADKNDLFFWEELQDAMLSRNRLGTYVDSSTPAFEAMSKYTTDRFGGKARVYTLDAPANTKSRFLDWDAPVADQPPMVQALAPDSAFPGVDADTWKELDDLAEMRVQFRTLAKEQLPLWGSDVPMDKFRFETMGQQIDELDKLITAKQLELFKKKVPDKLVWSDNPADEMLSGEDIADQMMGGLPSEATLAETAGLRAAGVPGVKNLANSTGKQTHNYVVWDQDLLNQMRIRAIDGERVPINPMFGPVKAEQRVIPQIADSPLTEVVNPMSPQPLPGLAKPAMQGAAYQALARFNSYGGSL